MVITISSFDFTMTVRNLRPSVGFGFPLPKQKHLFPFSIKQIINVGVKMLRLRTAISLSLAY